jgi:dihydrolipoamide dehydrogenase
MSEPEFIDCDLAVLGSGPGGYSAAFQASDLGLNVVLIERSATHGGVCLNVGCIPTKALLHTAAVMDAAAALSAHGISFDKPQIDLAALRLGKDRVVSKLTAGLAAMANARQVRVIQGTGTLQDANTIDVSLAAGSATRVTFKSAIIAAGSEAVILPFLPQDSRIVNSTGAL